MEVECMCLECGISIYLSLDSLSFEDVVVGGKKVVANSFCAECGGHMVVIGKAGDEPYYKLEP